mgnify:CR=1 FL=1
MFFQGAQQLRIGLAQGCLQVTQGRHQGRAGLLEQHRATEEVLVLAELRAVRQRVFEQHLAWRQFGVGDPAGIHQPGRQHVLHHMPADARRLVAAVPDQADLVMDHFGAAGAHVAHQFFERHDAVHCLAQGRAVHGDVAEHAPRVGQHEAR